MIRGAAIAFLASLAVFIAVASSASYFGIIAFTNGDLMFVYTGENTLNPKGVPRTAWTSYDFGKFTGWRATRGPGPWAYYTVSIPGWIPAVLLLAYPTVAAIRGPLRRQQRRRKGRCLECGYDLTGNVSGQCPECGTKT